ncbi:MAG: hypothetical protein WCK43_03405 [bacterium]|jgi:hypothetical protein
MKTTKVLKDFISSLHLPSQLNLERSKKLMEAQKEKDLQKANPPQWFDFLSEEARELLIPSVFIQKSSNSN